MKYLRTFYLALQSEFISRSNIVGWLVVGVIPSIVLVIVWLAILGDKSSINGFTKGDFIVYYLFITFSWYLVGGNFVFPLGNGIKEGEINTSLLKPYDVVLSHFIKEQAWKVLSIVVALPAAIFVLYTFRDIVHVNLTLMQGFMLVVSLFIGAINFALLEALSGISAFWVTEIWPITNLKDMLESLFGGKLVPLTLMPASISFVANILPFKYIFYVPTSILLSKSSNIYLDVGTQLLYLFILYLLYKLAWNWGIKRYEAVGI